jgi:hypothetical protein
MKKPLKNYLYQGILSSSLFPPIIWNFKSSRTTEKYDRLILHTGGCHCKRVRWEVKAPASVVHGSGTAQTAACGYTCFVVPSSKFKLNKACGKFITTYTFGILTWPSTHSARFVELLPFSFLDQIPMVLQLQ